ncbi:hypothetical protein VTO42DRAFT_8026 [Malbranchea cinnamomea]
MPEHVNGNGVGVGQKLGLTLTVLGCGTLGTAILSGIFASLSESKGPSEAAPQHPIPNRFIACVRGSSSAERIREALSDYDLPLTILQSDNIRGATEGDVIILGCKPWMLKDVLGDPGMREALKGKLLISILAGVTTTQIEETLYKDTNIPEFERCRVVRAMPNTAAVIRQSMTILNPAEPPLPPHLDNLVNWIFSRIGRVLTLPPSNMDVSTSLAGSGPAFCALVLEALADGGVAMGLPRAQAQTMAAQAMLGAASMVLDGEHPALIREKVSTPGGCTIGGLLVLEEGAVRGAVARSVREATVVASQLGQGIKNVNGTRH